MSSRCGAQSIKHRQNFSFLICHVEYTGISRKLISKWILEKQCVKMWNGLNWLRISSGGGLL
jgi:hypothetical protein